MTPTGLRRATGAGRVLVVGALVALAFTAGLVVRPARADAHATLESSAPEAGEQLAVAPKQVVLHFSESVETSDAGLQVLSTAGDRLDAGKPHHPNGKGSAVAVDLPKLKDGAYVVSWRVISADSHPVNGAFTFTVGNAAAGGSGANAQAVVKNVLAGAGADRSLGFVFGVVRFAAFAGLVLLVGGGLFMLGLWRGGASDPRARRIVALGWWLALVATTLSVPLQGAYGAGGSLADAFDPSIIGDEVGQRTGRVWLVRLLLLALVAAVGPLLLRRRARRDASTAVVRPLDAIRTSAPVLVPGFALGMALLATVSLAGHAVSGDLVPLAMATDLTHLGAVSVWLGGLAMLLGAVLQRPDEADGAPGDDPGDALDTTVALFSQVAFAAVVVIAASGTVQAWRQLRSWDALFDTTYGRLLLIKVGLVSLMLVAAAASRAWVRRRAAARVVPFALSPGPGAAAASPAGGRNRLAVLRQSVGAEVALAVLVLAVTSLLVNAVPGATASGVAGAGGAGGGPFSTTVHGNDVAVDVNVDPATAGLVDVHIYVTDHGGSPIQPAEVTATLTLADRDVGPIDLKLVPAGTGHYVASGADIPFPGTWQIVVIVRLSDIYQNRVTADLPIT